MTKRKIIRIVTLGFVLFYFASMAANYAICETLVARDFSEPFNEVYFKIDDFFMNYEIDERHKKTAESSGMSDISLIMQEFLTDNQLWTKYPFVFLALDEEGNRYEAYRNYVIVKLDDRDIYINLDEYLNDLQREELNEKSTKNIGVSDVKLGYDGKKYVLNEITFTDFIGAEWTYTYSDAEPVLQKGKYSDLCLSEISLRNYDKKYFSKIYETLDRDYELNDDFDGNGGGGYWSANEINGSHHMEIAGKKYLVSYASKYNLFLRTLQSSDFKSFSYILTLFFVITAVVFLVLCLRLNKKNEALETAKQVFVSAAAHELKTPISVIQNQCECVIENIAPEKNDEYIKSVYDESKRMGDVVSTMLWYNRLSTENKVTKARCSLSDLVRKEVMKYEAFSQSKGVTVETDITDDIYKYCDETLITMAVDNYLSNAIKYAKGEKKVKVSLKMDLVESRPTLTVFNTGDPIPDEHRNKIWDVFWRADKVRNSSDNSTGMGLAICKQVFRLHKYKYGYRNKENGVEFYFVTK